MVKNHYKNVAIPRTWHIPRKETEFVTRPYPGAHSLLYGIPLNIVLKEMVKCAQTTKEVKYILEHKDVFVDGVKRKECKLPVGLMDTLSLMNSNEHYRIVLNQRGHLIPVSIKKEESLLKPSKIINKTVVKKGKIQLNMSDGRSILLPKNSYTVGDTLLLKLPEQKIEQHLPLEPGMLVYMIGGKHIGAMGTVEKIEGNALSVRTGSNTYKTLRSQSFVIGKEKPIVSIQ